jgi:hypothetical protein
MAIHTWYQIHTNGGTTTFARWTTIRAENGVDILDAFEKMSVDTTSETGSAEIFGREWFTDGGATARLALAMESGR